MLGVNVIAADSDAEAALLRTSLEQVFVQLRRGRPGPLPPPRPGFGDELTPEERATLDETLACCFAGSPTTVRAAMDAFATRHGADELIVASHIHDHAARLRSYELLAAQRQPNNRATTSYRGPRPDRSGQDQPPRRRGRQGRIAKASAARSSPAERGRGRRVPRALTPTSEARRGTRPPARAPRNTPGRISTRPTCLRHTLRAFATSALRQGTVREIATLRVRASRRLRTSLRRRARLPVRKDRATSLIHEPEPLTLTPDESPRMRPGERPAESVRPLPAVRGGEREG